MSPRSLPSPDSSATGSGEPAPGLVDDPAEQAAFTRWRTAADGSAEAVSALRISGMYCAACAGAVEDALLRTPGVRQARVQAASARAEVVWAPGQARLSALLEAVRRAGYGALPDTAACERAVRARESRSLLWQLFVAGFCMMQVMMYASPAYLAGPGGIAPDQSRLLQWASWLLCIPVVLFSSRPFFGGLARSLRNRRIGMDVPVALGIAATFAASTAATFDPAGPLGGEVYFDSLAMFVFFLLGGRWLEMRARHRAASRLEDLLCALPEAVERIGADGRAHWVNPRQLRRGDVLRVQAGQRFAADGTLAYGRTEVDEALLTGESLPVVKAPGDPVVAGSVNRGQPVLVRVDRIGADTRLGGIQALVRDAASQKPGWAGLAQRCAAPFLWAVLLMAAAAGAAWSTVDPSKAVAVAVAVLIVTCPCALSLAAPSALLAATGALARRGVLLRRIDALEALAEVDLLFVDKTGTLTEDRIALESVEPLEPADGPAARRDWLPMAAGLAAWSSHPLSRALAEAGTGTDPAPGWTEVREVPGRGLQGRAADGRLWRLGGQAWVEGGHAARQDQQGGGGLALWFGAEGRPSACFHLRERLRPDAEEAVDRLRRDGVRVELLSGDLDHRVRAMARRLRLDAAHGAAAPADKLAIVRRAQAEGRRVAMVGDGLNDAPVLAQAQVSFALSHGAGLSQSNADAVLLSDRLLDVWRARRLARRALRVMRQNLAWAAAYNLCCVPLALAGWLPPWAAGLGMAGSSLAVVLNALRLSRWPACEVGGAKAVSAAPPRAPAQAPRWAA